MRIHGSTLEDLPNLQNGLAFSEKLLRERRDLVKRILRARSRAYRLARPAFTANGLPTDKEVEDFLRADAEVLKLREPVPAAKIFGFSLQKEVNLELGIK